MGERENTWHGQHQAGLSRGERAADYLRNGMGSWIFVNLFLSMLAGLQGAILLIAAKRQDAIAAAMAQHDYDTDVQAKTEIDRLMAINSQQLELLEELRALLLAARDPHTETEETIQLPREE